MGNNHNKEHWSVSYVKGNPETWGWYVDAATEAVKHDGLALKHITEQEKITNRGEICLNAVKQNPKAFRYIERPHTLPNIIEILCVVVGSNK